MQLSRTLLSCLVFVLPCLVLSDPQRRKREIMAEILAEAVEAVGRQERSPPAGHGHQANAQHHESPQHRGSSHHGHPANAQHHESPQHRGSSHHKRSADPQHISQNCAGGRCNQNNIAAGHGSAGHGSAGHGSAGHGSAGRGSAGQHVGAGHGSAGHGSAGFAGFFPSIAQNCINGACNQNNVLRRKREVLAHLLEEARKIAEEEVEAEEAISRRKREGLNDEDCVVGPSGEKVCPHGAYGSDGESRVLARGNQGPGLTGSNGNAGPVSAAGLAYDPAAEAYKQQIIAYQAWAEQQVENARGQLGTA